MSDEICGKCLHHRKDDEIWVCNNPESECYGCYTEYTDECTEFEERHPKSRLRVEIVSEKN